MLFLARDSIKFVPIVVCLIKLLYYRNIVCNLCVRTTYVRDEFRRHKTCNEAEAAIFLNEWTEYALMLADQLGLKGPHTAKLLGQNLRQEDFEKFRDEQVYQLYELMNAATNKTDKDIK
ncbi:succinate dehydrogenase assembly factor 3 isoform X1 [Colletes latitarsis]|uniref:succinate dehydrogenase assembly factor 3 isoform X1 n=1 Tax=Colletes latitarsis TaxID=2605962 RepID=UPI004037573E